MMALSPKQIQEAMDLIHDQHTAFLVRILGYNAVPKAELDRLRRKGLLPARTQDLPQRAYEFGVMVSAEEDARMRRLSYAEFMKRILANPIPLTYEEKAAVAAVRRSLFNRIKGLGNTYDQRTQAVLVEADNALRRRLQTRVKQQLIAGIEQRKTIKEISSELARVSGDQERDWQRIASTEIHNAFLEGRASAISLRNKGSDPRVFKRPRPDCCPECAKAYLEGDQKTPKVFLMSELVANGTTNEGRKLKAWKPTLGCLHPFCQCTLHELPPGFEFDQAGGMSFVGS